MRLLRRALVIFWFASRLRKFPSLGSDYKYCASLILIPLLWVSIQSNTEETWGLATRTATQSPTVLLVHFLVHWCLSPPIPPPSCAGGWLATVSAAAPQPSIKKTNEKCSATMCCAVLFLEPKLHIVSYHAKQQHQVSAGRLLAPSLMPMLISICHMITARERGREGTAGWAPPLGSSMQQLVRHLSECGLTPTHPHPHTPTHTHHHNHKHHTPHTHTPTHTPAHTHTNTHTPTHPHEDVEWR